MGKRSRKQMQWNGKSKLGCMWSWISLFDFGHGGGNQKLLSDKRCNSLNASAPVDNGAPERKLKMLKDVEQIGQLPKLGESMTDGNKQSVKKLIEEEMGTESTKKRNKIALSGSELGTLVRRNQKKASKICKTSSQMDIPDSNTPEKLGSDDSGSDLYIEAIMQEIFSHIQEKSMNWSNNQQGEPLREQKLSLLEERINEATKAIMHRKFLNGERLTEARKVQYYNKYMDTLEMLDTNKEFFLKLSEDPNSSLMKQFKKIPSNDYIQKHRNSLRLSEEHGSDVQYTILRKEVRLQNGRDTDINSKKSELSNKIVILKPERTELRASATESGSLVRYNAASQFSFSEIRKKLRFAMQKDRHGTSGDVVNMSTYKFQKLRIGDNAQKKDNLGMCSPSRNHFYVEKVPRPSSGSKMVEKIKNKNDASAKQRVSNIYTEAKRHLSEMLSKGDEDEGLSSRQTSKTLERLLSVPDINISHSRVPGRHSFDHNISGVRLSTHAELLLCNKSSLETESANQVDLDDLWSPSSETDICASDDYSINASEVCLPNSENGKETFLEDKDPATVMDSLNTISEGVMEGLETLDSLPEITDTAPDAICESANLVDTIDDQNTCSEETDEVEASSEHNEQDILEEYTISSPLVHPFFSAINIDTDDIASPADKSERPSPISVLEYVFSEDEFSPAGSESHLGNVEPRRLRPIRIQFDEDELSTTAHDAYIQGCVDSHKISFQYVEAVLSLTDLRWEELYMTSLFSSQLLNEAVFDEVEELFSQLPYEDRRLLFNCVNEILNGMCQRYFSGCPLLSFLKLNIRPVPEPEKAVQEVWKGVEWHLLPPPHPQTLEQIVKKNMELDSVWMDLNLDIEELSIVMETTILQELMEEAVLSCIEVLVR